MAARIIVPARLIHAPGKMQTDVQGVVNRLPRVGRSTCDSRQLQRPSLLTQPPDEVDQVRHLLDRDAFLQVRGHQRKARGSHLLDVPAKDRLGLSLGPLQGHAGGAFARDQPVDEQSAAGVGEDVLLPVTSGVPRSRTGAPSRSAPPRGKPTAHNLLRRRRCRCTRDPRRRSRPRRRTGRVEATARRADTR